MPCGKPSWDPLTLSLNGSATASFTRWVYRARGSQISHQGHGRVLLFGVAPRSPSSGVALASGAFHTLAWDWCRTLRFNGCGEVNPWWPACGASVPSGIASPLPRMPWLSLRNGRSQDDACFFVDPPYSYGEGSPGAKLYLHHEVDHDALLASLSGVAVAGHGDLRPHSCSSGAGHATWLSDCAPGHARWTGTEATGATASEARMSCLVDAAPSPHQRAASTRRSSNRWTADSQPSSDAPANDLTMSKVILSSMDQ